MTRDAKFRQAAWTYLAYGVVYWLGGLVLIAAGLGPPGSGPGARESLIVLLLVVGGLIPLLVPWVLLEERPWFDRWIFSRRDFARILALVLAFRAYEVARIAAAPRIPIVSVGGYAIPMRVGAAAVFVITVVAAVMLARAAWSRQP